MTTACEAREYVARLTDGELTAALGRQLSARLRHAVLAERAFRSLDVATERVEDQ